MVDAPTNVHFNDTNTEDELTLDWDEVSGADEYYIYRALSSGSTTSDYTRVATPTAPPYTDTGLNDGEKYFYRLSSFSAVPASGVARWTFDNADTDSGTAVDSWGSNDGTINGATTGVSGANQTYATNEAYSFDGSDDYVSTPLQQDSSDVDSPVSFAVWYKLANENQSTLFGNHDGLGLYFTIARDGTDHVSFRTYDGSFFGVSATVSGATNTGVWRHMVGVHDGSDYIVYMDGSEVARTTQSKWVAVSSNILIGIRGDDAHARPFDGDLDDPRVYSKALTSTEVSNLYNTGSIDG